MERDPMTAEVLNQMVSQWPVEARDKDLVFNPANKYGETLGWECEGEFITDRHAIALHEASGIKWLCTNPTLPVRIYTVGIETWWAVDFDSVRPGHFQAPTLIEALHAAIMATAKEEA